MEENMFLNIFKNRNKRRLQQLKDIEELRRCFTQKADPSTMPLPREFAKTLTDFLKKTNSENRVVTIDPKSLR